MNKCLRCGERIPECKCITMNIEEATEYLKNYKYDNEVRKAIETVLNELENKDKEIAYWKEQAEGYSGLAKQIQEEYENRIDEFVNRDRFE